MSPQFQTPPPTTTYCLLSFPQPHTLLVQLNRPRSLNCINVAGHAELHDVWEWFDAEPSLRVAILTEWNTKNSTSGKVTTPPSGFGGISRRSGKKPIICAINGLCLGGGCEIIINADLNIASARAVFALPEVKRGVLAIAGGLPRLVRTVGRQRAMEMALTGRTVSAAEAERWGLVNEVVQVGEGDSEEVVSERVVKRALDVAGAIAANSPDSVIVTREGVKMGWEGVGAEEGTRLLIETWEKRLYEGENMKEGVKAFVEKREPKWLDSKL
ncbi:Transcriptional adapter ada2 [Paecilomyces lecythidis]|uniref:Transcriptional adapter ada2 n=1 Tax=Paecilomyces lecythidis TaxID=3004212 RepID=A0ABR3YBM9_9EURO